MSEYSRRLAHKIGDSREVETSTLHRRQLQQGKLYTVFSHLPDLWTWSVGLCCGEIDPGGVFRVAGWAKTRLSGYCRMQNHGPDVCCTRCVEMVCAR